MKRSISIILTIVLTLSVFLQDVPAAETLIAGADMQLSMQDPAADTEEVVLPSEETAGQSTVPEAGEQNDPAPSEGFPEDGLTDAEEIPAEDEMLRDADEAEELDEMAEDDELLRQVPMDGLLHNEDEEAVESLDAETYELLCSENGYSSLPSSYRTSRLPVLRNQGHYGTCWAHSAISLAEINMMKKNSGLSPDYSELHLGWFTYNPPSTDPLGNVDGFCNPGGYNTEFLTTGGNQHDAIETLAAWIGVADESAAPYTSADSVKSRGLSESIAFQDRAHLINAYRINMETEEDRMAVKQAVRDYGAVAISMKVIKPGQSASESGQTYSYGEVYSKLHNCYYLPAKMQTNHEVTVVGWDDNFSRSNFVTQPEGNGAWLVRNSWTSRDGEESIYGYFWLSYYDKSVSVAYAFDMDRADNYARNYQYDGPQADNSAISETKGTGSFANVFTSKASSSGETLRAVSFNVSYMTGLSYEISVYMNPTNAGDPESGHLVSMTAGNTTYAGYYTIPLDQPVALSNGNRFSVVVSFSKPDEYIHYSLYSYENGSHAGETGKSYYKTRSGWVDYSAEGSCRIKAFTTDGMDASTIPWFVLYHSNNGAEQKSSQAVLKGQNGTIKGSLFEKNGYTFQNWNTEANGSGTTYRSGDTVRDLRGDYGVFDLYAQWEAKKSVMTFDANGGSCATASQTVTYDATYGTLPTPSRAGYRFEGWFTTGSSPVQIKAQDTVTATEDFTVRARWSAKKYTVTLDPNGGGYPGMESTEVTYDSTYGYLPTPVWTGYSFAGWFTQKTGGTLVSASTIVKTANDHTLYAHWAAKAYTVTFDANGGHFTIGGQEVPSTTKQVCYQEMFGELPKPVREGYVFQDWCLDPAHPNVGLIRPDTPFDYEDDLTLKAWWQPHPYPVTLDANGGIFTVYSETGVSYVTTKESSREYDGKYGKLISEIEWENPSKEGYDLAGWYTKPYGGDLIEEDTIHKVAGPQTLYAHWTPKQYTVTLDAMEGHFTVNGQPVSETAVTVTYNEPYGELPEPERDGYEFGGWTYWSDSYEQLPLDEQMIVRITKEQRLFAKWLPKAVKVTLDLDGGTCPDSEMIVRYDWYYGGESGNEDLPTPVKPGYRFLGWYTQKTGGDYVWSGKRVETTIDHSIYARWEAKKLTVTLNANGGRFTIGSEKVPTTSRQVTYNETYGDFKTTPTWKGCVFEGWFTAQTGGAEVTATTTVTATENHTLWAHWSGTPEPVGLRAEGISASYVYTGSAIRPEPRVYYDDDDSKLLKKDQDYTLTYYNNVDAGDAYVTITGKGSYSGSDSIRKDYKILPRNLGSPGPYANEFRADDIRVPYSGQARVPDPVVLRDGKKLIGGTDYTIQIKDPNGQTVTSCLESGTYIVTITGTGNYTGSRTLHYVIEERIRTSILKAKITVKNKAWDGTASEPVVSVAMGRAQLVRNTDYVLIWPGQNDPVDPVDTDAMTDTGTVTIKIRGINAYEGEVSKTYKITGTALNARWIKGLAASYPYRGQAYYPLGEPDSNSDHGNCEITSPNGTLVKGRDYTVQYSNNINAGTAVMTVTGRGGYSGTVTKKFTIKPDTAPKADAFTIAPISVPFVKGGCTPDLASLPWKDGSRSTLVRDKDYKITWQNNQTAAGPDAAKYPRIHVAGLGNYRGMSFDVPFTITATNIKDNSLVQIDVPNMVCTGKPGGYAVTPILIDRRNGKLMDKKDYAIVEYCYAEDTNKVMKKEKKELVSVPKKKGDPVLKTDIIPEGVKLYVKIKGIGGYTNETEVKFWPAKGNLAKVTAKIADQTYTGEAVTLEKYDFYFVIPANGTEIWSDDFEIVRYINNTKVGTAKVIIRGTGNYAGTKTLTFKIKK